MLVYKWDREKIIDSLVIIPLFDNEIFSQESIGPRLNSQDIGIHMLDWLILLPGTRNIEVTKMGNASTKARGRMRCLAQKKRRPLGILSSTQPSYGTLEIWFGSMELIKPKAALTLLPSCLTTCG